MKEQFIVNESSIDKREAFYDYIIDNYNLHTHNDKDDMINSSFPFVVDFKRNDFWVCKSITCCACASQNNRIITIQKFKQKVRKR